MSGDVRPPTVERAEGPDRPQSVISHSTEGYAALAVAPARTAAKADTRMTCCYFQSRKQTLHIPCGFTTPVQGKKERSRYVGSSVDFLYCIIILTQRKE